MSFYRERFSKVGLYENSLFEDFRPLLYQLKTSGFRLYVATSKPEVYAKQIINHFNLTEFFQKVYGSELTGERTCKKELLKHILKEEYLSSESCIMIGDRRYDIEGAHANGIKSIAVHWGFGSRQEIDAVRPNRSCETITELKDVIFKLSKT